MLGGGSDIWGNSDSFYFVPQANTGDVTMRVHILDLNEKDHWTKFGLMIRETQDADSRNTFCYLSANYGPLSQMRFETGADTHVEGWNSGPKVDTIWLELAKRGDEYTCSFSEDGNEWKVVGKKTNTMGQSVQYGMALTSHNNGLLAEGIFQNYEANFPLEYFSTEYDNLSSTMKNSSTNFLYGELEEILEEDNEAKGIPLD